MHPDADVPDRVRAPRPPNWERVRTRFTRDLARLSLGLVQGRDDGFWLGPVPLIRLGPPEPAAGGVRFPVTGGLLARRPGGQVGVEWADGELRGWVRGYEPSLPSPLYELTQRFAHHQLTRLYLLELRGPEPPPGRPDPRGGPAQPAPGRARRNSAELRTGPGPAARAALRGGPGGRGRAPSTPTRNCD